MKTFDFPFCCTAKIFAEFGQTVVTAGDMAPKTAEAIEEYIKKQMARMPTMAFFTAVTNSDQKAAIVALRRLGFMSSRWIEKKHHPETKVKLWWKPVIERKIKKTASA